MAEKTRTKLVFTIFNFVLINRKSYHFFNKNSIILKSEPFTNTFLLIIGIIIALYCRIQFKGTFIQ